MSKVETSPQLGSAQMQVPEACPNQGQESALVIQKMTLRERERDPSSYLHMLHEINLPTIQQFLELL